MTSRRPTLVAGTLLALLLLAGSVAATRSPAPKTSPAGPESPLQLVSFDSCADALTELRAATAAEVHPWGIANGAPQQRSALELLDASGAAESRPAGEHSLTNGYEPGVDEPDLVKTDGQRIVTISQGVLRVVDPTTNRFTGRLDLNDGPDQHHWAQHDLLLYGDHAVVLTDAAQMVLPAFGPSRELPPDSPQPGLDIAESSPRPATRVRLVDLSGPPRLLSTYDINGRTLDARQTGSTVRVVVQSHPQVTFPELPATADDATREEANRAAVAAAGIEAWLPAYEWTAGAEHGSGRVDCDRLSRPQIGTGSAVLTVLSFDLTASRLTDGDPVSVAAAADTVYSTGDSLYLAGQRQLAASPTPGRWPNPVGASVTDIYQFDTTAAGRPRYVAAGSVPGRLINQYALSQWQGHLRVATTTTSQLTATTGQDAATTNREATTITSQDERSSESGVHVLRRQGEVLTRTGAVTGLGPGERIYSVRYLGDTAYVVTFRRTDPLYALDLSDHAAPRVTGELKITGYSAYLHPVADGRLLGIGQEADLDGRTQGVQVSLFDVRDPTQPLRLDRWHRPDAWSAAEHDPHAFRYDPSTGLLAVPVNAGLRLLRVSGDALTDQGEVTHPAGGHITRSLLVGDTLWTVSDAGLRATDPMTGQSLAWLPNS
ncbi:beta-propeller domain-containing protein [Salinispora oceanensis]|uniref:beta-propeller domain-containing protein n=1 Tax=Salinispora oceanensis TaxID=1050199 RepID=UPI000367909F|nr:beta-propeller domain-containing protein [Salinispora oceanensis]